MSIPQVCGIALISSGITLAMDQIIPGWWKMEQIFSFLHHENFVVIFMSVGLILIGYGELRKRKTQQRGGK